MKLCKHIAVTVLSCLLAVCMLTACGGVGQILDPSGDSDASSEGMYDVPVITETSTQGTALSYSKSVTGQFFASLGSSYTSDCRAVKTVSSNTEYTTEYYTTDGTRAYINRISSGDTDDELFANVHMLYMGNSVGYVLNEKKRQAVMFENDCIPADGLLESLHDVIDGYSFTSGTGKVNGTTYYCESTVADGCTHTFYFDSSNTLKYYKQSYGSNNIILTVKQLETSYNENKFSLSRYGYTILRNVYGYTISYPAVF